jgi:hypothetical protein
MKKTTLIFGVILLVITSSCSPKEQPAETKEEKKLREKIERLRKSSDSLNRSADSLKEVQIHLEKFYDRAIRLMKAGLTESQAIQKVAETDSTGYAIYMINEQNKIK